MDNNGKHDFLGIENINSLIIKLSLPALIGMLSNALYNMVDSIFIGHGAGALAIAGLSVAFPFQMLIGAFALMFGVGAASLISINLGKKNEERAALVAGNAFVITLLVGIAFAIIGTIFIRPLLIVFGASEEILPYAKSYMNIILIGAPFLSFSMCSNNILRSEGAAKVSMTVMLLGTVINLILDPIFIFYFKMGISGAAYATIIGQIISSLYALNHFRKKKSSLSFTRKSFNLQFSIIREIALIGFATFVRQLGTSLMALVVNNSLGFYGGDFAIAAFGIINRILALILMPTFGLNQGLQPIIGYNFGAKKYDRLRLALKKTIIYSTLIGLVGSLIAFSFPNVLMKIFTTNEELISIGSYAIRIIFATLTLIGIQTCGTTYFQALGLSKPAIFLGLSRQFIFLIPLVLILPRFIGLNGVWLAFPMVDILSTLVTVIWLISNMKKLNIN